VAYRFGVSRGALGASDIAGGIGYEVSLGQQGVVG